MLLFLCWMFFGGGGGGGVVVVVLVVVVGGGCGGLVGTWLLRRWVGWRLAVGGWRRAVGGWRLADGGSVSSTLKQGYADRDSTQNSKLMGPESTLNPALKQTHARPTNPNSPTALRPYFRPPLQQA